MNRFIAILHAISNIRPISQFCSLDIEFLIDMHILIDTPMGANCEHQGSVEGLCDTSDNNCQDSLKSLEVENLPEVKQAI